MKKIFVAFIGLFFLIALPVLADDSFGGSYGIEDAMQYTNYVENVFNGQKPVTDDEFQNALDQVKAKQNKGKKKKKQFSGKNFNQEDSSGYIDETAEKSLLLSVPLSLINGDGTEIPIGHYSIVGKKVEDKVYLEFYQSATLVAKVPAIETQSDFNKTAINFVQLLPYNSERIKIIYGSVDFNAYTFIKIKDKISDEN